MEEEIFSEDEQAVNQGACVFIDSDPLWLWILIQTRLCRRVVTKHGQHGSGRDCI